MSAFLSAVKSWSTLSVSPSETSATRSAGCILVLAEKPAPRPRCAPDPRAASRSGRRTSRSAGGCAVLRAWRRPRLCCRVGPAASPLTVASLSGVAMSTLSKSKVSICCSLPFSKNLEVALLEALHQFAGFCVARHHVGEHKLGIRLEREAALRRIGDLARSFGRRSAARPARRAPASRARPRFFG